MAGLYSLLETLEGNSCLAFPSMSPSSIFRASKGVCLVLTSHHCDLPSPPSTFKETCDDTGHTQIIQVNLPVFKTDDGTLDSPSSCKVMYSQVLGINVHGCLPHHPKHKPAESDWTCFVRLWLFRVRTKSSSCTTGQVRLEPTDGDGDCQLQ